MMRVHASAPGKLVMTGDYAVLEGAPAVVLAVSRRAHVELATQEGKAFCVDAPDLAIHAVNGRLEDGSMDWSADSATVGRLGLVTAVLEYLARHDAAPDPASMTLDTNAFFEARARAKLGLGSSAALTVALTAALQTAGGHATPDFSTLIAMHRQMQDGRGSGLDIATSVLGGAVLYRLRDDEPEATRATWPGELAMRCVWSGRSASTGQALARLAAWRQSHEAAYKGYMHSLTACAEAVASALGTSNAATMAQGMADYGDILARFGQAAGIDIVCAEHRALMDIARASGVTYKTCGAGGGDVGVAVSTDPDRLEHFSRQVAAAGFLVLETGIDSQGLRVEQLFDEAGEIHGQRTQA